MFGCDGTGVRPARRSGGRTPVGPRSRALQPTFRDPSDTPEITQSTAACMRNLRCTSTVLLPRCRPPRSCVECTPTPLRCSWVSRCHGARRNTAPPRPGEHRRELPTTRAPLDAHLRAQAGGPRERSAIRGRGMPSPGCLSTMLLRARLAIDEPSEPAGRASPTRGQGSPPPCWRRGCPPRSSAGCRG